MAYGRKHIDRKIFTEPGDSAQYSQQAEYIQIRTRGEKPETMLLKIPPQLAIFHAKRVFGIDHYGQRWNLWPNTPQFESEFGQMADAIYPPPEDRAKAIEESRDIATQTA